MLAKKLAALHAFVAARSKLKKPKKSDVAALEACVGKLPADLGAFFAVFNGQDGTEPVVPGTNRSLLSARAALEAWKTCEESSRHEDEGAPWKKPWVPFLENGGGDFLVYDRKTGVLRAFWHDDDKAPKEYGSLEAWVDECLRKLDKPKKAPAKDARFTPKNFTVDTLLSVLVAAGLDAQKDDDGDIMVSAPGICCYLSRSKLGDYVRVDGFYEFKKRASKQARQALLGRVGESEDERVVTTLLDTEGNLKLFATIGIDDVPHKAFVKRVVAYTQALARVREHDTAGILD